MLPFLPILFERTCIRLSRVPAIGVHRCPLPAHTVPVVCACLQVVVATLFVECNVRLIACCEKFGFVADRFDGKMTQKNRLESMARFQEGKSDVMCMLMFAGGRGLNFQNANHLVSLIVTRLRVCHIPELFSEYWGIVIAFRANPHTNMWIAAVLSLTLSSQVITSPWWNPVVLDQTRRRVWRVGSKHAVVTM